MLIIDKQKSTADKALDMLFSVCPNAIVAGGAPRDRWIVGLEFPCWNKGLVDLLIEADNMKWDVPKIIRDFDLGFYVTPHVY